MISPSKDYSMFLKFAESYSGRGFQRIDQNDVLIRDLEEMMGVKDQFFLVADIIQMKYLFVSRRSTQMIGIDPGELSPYHFFEATHPDDILRHSLGRAQLFKIAHELFTAEKGHSLLSTNIRLRNTGGGFSSILLQLYFYYTRVPYNSVFLIKIHTNIDWFKKRKHGYHYYLGNDLSYFRYPDEDLLMTGNVFSDREFEIIKLIEKGLTSEQISEMLFLSVHTVNTHRRNILEKTGKAHISDLIYDLRQNGVL